MNRELILPCPGGGRQRKGLGGHPLPPGDGSFKPGKCGKGGTPSSEVPDPDYNIDISPPSFEPGVRQVYRRRILQETSQSGGSSAGDHGRGLQADRASIASLLPVTCYNIQTRLP